MKWLPVVGWEGVYNVSDTGVIFSVRRGRPLKGVYDRKGYHLVALSQNGTCVTRRVHRLVCEAFHGPAPEGKPFVLHWDDDPSNNRADNLRWGDVIDNRDDLIRNGSPFDIGSLNRSKTHCPKGHEYTPENARYDKINRRYCRACRREAFREMPRDALCAWDPRHGTSNGYLNLKCRCGECTAAYTEYLRARRRRK